MEKYPGSPRVHFSQSVNTKLENAIVNGVNFMQFICTDHIIARKF